VQLGSDHGASFASSLTSLLLISNVIAPIALPIARVLWSMGALRSAGFLCFMVTRWLQHQRLQLGRGEIETLTESWLRVGQP
jgi:hypothetical protein